MRTLMHMALTALVIGCGTQEELAFPRQVLAEEAYPADIRQFMSRRDLCDHFRGEEPYDAERRHFLEMKMKNFCTGTDGQLARLKEKYRDNAHILNKLNEYEANIEGEGN